MLQAFGSYNFPSYKEIKTKSYLWYEYILNGHVLDDVKNNLYEVRNFAVKHPEYSKTIGIFTSGLAIAGAGYGYTKKYPFVTSAMITGLNGLLLSTAGCTIHYWGEEIKSTVSLFLDSIAEHYIISLTSFGFLIGVPMGTNMGTLSGVVGGTIVGIAGAFVGTTITIGSTIYSNYKKPFEIITEISSIVINIKDGLSWIWGGIISLSHSSYECVVNNYITLAAMTVGGLIGRAVAVETAMEIKVEMEVEVTGAAIGGVVTVIYNHKEKVGQMIEKVKSGTYKFFVEEHLIESATAIIAVVGGRLAMEQHKIYIGVMAMFRIGIFAYENLKPSEEEIKKWLIGDDRNSKCDVQEGCREVEEINLTGSIIKGEIDNVE